MAVTLATIRARLPEFAAVPDADVQQAIDAAAVYINRTQWGETKADEGQIYLTGHLLLFFDQGSGLSSGPVSAESEGQLSIAYAVGEAFKDSAYGSTAYGRQYLQILGTVFSSRFACC